MHGLPHKRKRLIDILAFWEAPAVVYPASKVDSVLVRAAMESASLMRQSLQAAGNLPEGLPDGKVSLRSLCFLPYVYFCIWSKVASA